VRHSPQHTLAISLAKDTLVFESHAVTTVQRYPTYWYYLVLLFLCLLAAFAFLASTSTLLRATLGSAAPQSAPFSLGLAQMAFWFFLALAAYIYVCTSTLQIHVPMGSMLGLMGISATTALAAVAVDVRKRNEAPADASGNPAQANSKSKGFLFDILSDGDGVSFHRFQIAVWTIVLGGVFVWNVYRYMALPEFDPSLLTLMGISSGTYVGFKFPESSK
jgi:hypothetical protein